MKRRAIFLSIILLATFLRFYKLGVNPPALDWDEASLGYNAYSILITGKDEFGNLLPISIRSFEDYKPALYVYLSIPFIYLLGLSEIAIRLPSAIFGILTVLLTYFLVKKLLELKDPIKNYPNIRKFPLLVMLLLAISPWHIQFSRVAFEANLGLFLVVGGIWLFFWGLQKGQYLLGAAILFSLAFYSYHSPRLVVPLLLIGWSVYFRKLLWAKKKWVVIALILGLVLLLPFIKEITSKGQARFSSVTVLSPYERLDMSIKKIDQDLAQGNGFGKLIHNRRVIYLLAVINGYLDHFNLDFLFLSGDAPDRHHAKDMGMLYLWEAPFILIGLMMLLKSRSKIVIGWWYLVAPTASAITTGTPHAVRALLYLPIYQIITAIGFDTVFTKFRHHPKLYRTSYTAGLFCIIFINVFYYLNMYFRHTEFETSQAWQYGYKQAVSEITRYESEVNKVVMTYAYDQPHIFVLFYKKIDPSWYQSTWQGGEVKRMERSFGKYEFRNITWENDKNLKNTLFIGKPSDFPADVYSVSEIKFLDGTVAFKVVKS